ncbi:MAG: hypothetical protein FWG90_00075 [Oscillospiraceae bacterium]|nr:hypothetical protein [Oscillospiraceae bacterium]
MKKGHIEIFHNHLNEINKAQTTKEINHEILRFVIVLLEKVDYSSKVLSTYEHEEMLELFADMGEPTATACLFYEKAKGFLDPETQNDSLIQDIAASAEEVTEVNGLIKEIISNEKRLRKDNAQLLKQQQEYAEIKDEYEHLVKIVSNLNEIKETLTHDKISAVYQEKEELQKEVNVKTGEKETLLKEIGKLESLKSDLSETIMEFNDEKNTIETNIIDIIDSRKEEAEKIFNAHSRRIDEIIIEIQTHISNFEQIKNDVKKANELYAGVKVHLREDSEILNAFEAKGIKMPDDFFETTKNLREKAEKSLNETEDSLSDLKVFDEYLKKALLKLETTQKEIRALQSAR